eukprot:6196195-Pleurochrysis_carterae.AAC.2
MAAQATAIATHDDAAADTAETADTAAADTAVAVAAAAVASIPSATASAIRPRGYERADECFKSVTVAPAQCPRQWHRQAGQQLQTCSPKVQRSCIFGFGQLEHVLELLIFCDDNMICSVACRLSQHHFRSLKRRR